MFWPIAFGAAASGLIPLAAAAPAERPGMAAFLDVSAELAKRAHPELRPFYTARRWQPLWLSPSGEILPAAFMLLREVEAARIDGLKPGKLKVGELRKALDRADDSDPQDLAKVELAASRVYAAYVKALRAEPRAAMLYENEALAPVVPTTIAALQAAAAAPSLDDFVAANGWMHPLYAPLRQALLTADYTDQQRRQLVANLARVRALPAWPADRYVLIDAGGQMLWLYERGQPVASMRVVVGKPEDPTPMMAGWLRYAILNPYWNVPDDLVAGRIARNVLDKGIGYLRSGGYEVLSGWDAGAAKIHPATVDWAAVAGGQRQVRVRQKPGAGNFMGRVKFMFPNAQGIYLHDTPDKNLMLADERTFSSGCVRLEDASRLGRWLLGKSLPRKVSGAERKIALPQPVPVYITYLTAFPNFSGPDRTGVAFRADPYGRDGPARFATRSEPSLLP